MNLPELSVVWDKWNRIKKEIPVEDVAIMKEVEKMTSAKRESLLKEYESGDKATRVRLEKMIQTISIFQGQGLEEIGKD